MSGGTRFNNLIISSIKPGNTYVLFFRNGRNIILKIKKVSNGLLQGYDHFGMLTALSINRISGFGELPSFPKIKSAKNQHRNQIEYVSDEEKSSSSQHGVAKEENSNPIPYSAFQGKGKNNWEGKLQQQTYSLPSTIAINLEGEEILDIHFGNVNENNEDSLNVLEYKTMKQINSKTLLSLKTISINGNSVIEKSGRACIKRNGE